MTVSGVPTTEFSSPAEYLHYVLAAYRRPWQRAVPDPAWVRLTKEALASQGTEYLSGEAGHDFIVGTLMEPVVKSFQRRQGIDITKTCAVGILDDPSVNARCFRSPEGHYAIVLHVGLTNLLHKHSKLLTAAVEPRRVTYCNRTDPATLTRELLVSWADELGDIYLSGGVVRGAMVKLDEQATFAAGLILTLAETFVVGHEVGHMVAGHLEDPERLTADRPVAWLRFYAENSSHRDEFEADAYGFQALTDYVDRPLPPALTIPALSATFEALRLIGAGEASATHPAARDRIHRIVETHFDARIANLVHRWLHDGDRAAATELLDL